MLHEPCRTVGRQSTLLHAVQHGGVSCMGITNPPLALSGHARQFRAETLCSASCFVGVIRWHARLSSNFPQRGHAQFQRHHVCTQCFCAVHRWAKGLAQQPAQAPL